MRSLANSRPVFSFTCPLFRHPSDRLDQCAEYTDSRPIWLFSMHPLMARVLELRQLNQAGQLFALSDYDVITDLVSFFF